MWEGMDSSASKRGSTANGANDAVPLNRGHKCIRKDVVRNLHCRCQPRSAAWMVVARGRGSARAFARTLPSLLESPNIQLMPIADEVSALGLGLHLRMSGQRVAKSGFLRYG